MKIAIAGATGVLGRHVLPRLLERGHDVTAIVRTIEQAGLLERMNVRSHIGSILDRDSLSSPLDGADCVLHLATSIPKNPASGDWSMNDRIRRDGTRNLLDAARVNGVRRYIQQSITLLYGDYGSRIVDETAPLQPPEMLLSAVDMETQVRECPLEWCILRGGLFYGPHSGTEERWMEQARAGTLLLPQNGNALVSLIHTVDMARAVVAAAERAPVASIYNVVDDEPISYTKLFSTIANLANAPEPMKSNRETPSLGCSNKNIKRDLDWFPAFPGIRSGLAMYDGRKNH